MAVSRPSRPFSFVSLAVLWLLCTAAVPAQPSGGPYGPRALTYSPPPDAGQVIYVAPDGRADAPGTQAAPTTLERAIARATTGDAVILRGGTYRTGNLQLNQGIVLQPHGDEQPVLKGTRVADEWVKQDNGLWRTAWSRLFPMAPEGWWRRHREGRKTPVYRFNNDMVFVDGRPLRAVGWEGELDENSFYIDYAAGQIYLATDPTGRLVEITAEDNALTRVLADVHGRPSDGRGPIIRGLTFTQYAYRAIEIEGRNPEGVSPESEHGKDVIGTTLEDVTITHCSRVGGYFRGDRMVFRHCLVSDTSTEGIFILSSSDVLLERNVFTRNNVEEITGYYPAAVKIFNQCYRVVCRDNLVIDQPNSNGIWYDVGNVDAVFVNNWIEGALDGFFFEISRGALVAGNVFVDCDKGLRSLNAAGVRAYQNTFINSVASFERTERSAVGDHFGWHPATGPDVDERHDHEFVNNLLAASADFPKALLRFEQPKALAERLTRPHVNRLDHNVYVRAPGAGRRPPLLVWSPLPGEAAPVEFHSLADFRARQPEFAAHSVYLPMDYNALLRSPRLGHYEAARPDLLPPGAPLPADVARELQWPAGQPVGPGAYPHR